jgi:hypothetical protein
MVTPMGITDLVRGLVVDFVFPYIPWLLLPREILDARDLAMEALFAFFSSLGASSRSRLLLRDRRRMVSYRGCWPRTLRAI